MGISINIQLKADPDLLALYNKLLGAIETMSADLSAQISSLNKSLSDTATAVSGAANEIQGLKQQLQTLSQQLADSGSVSDADKAALDDLAAKFEAQAQALNAAVNPPTPPASAS